LVHSLGHSIRGDDKVCNLNCTDKYAAELYKRSKEIKSAQTKSNYGKKRPSE